MPDITPHPNSSIKRQTQPSSLQQPTPSDPHITNASSFRTLGQYKGSYHSVTGDSTSPSRFIPVRTARPLQVPALNRSAKMTGGRQRRDSGRGSEFSRSGRGRVRRDSSARLTVESPLPGDPTADSHAATPTQSSGPSTITDPHRPDTGSTVMATALTRSSASQSSGSANCNTATGAYPAAYTRH